MARAGSTMETTTRANEAARTENSAPRPDERARARAYLDLWERHLVLTALEGPVPRWIAGGP
jgi:hypothetical protein